MTFINRTGRWPMNLVQSIAYPIIVALSFSGFLAWGIAMIVFSSAPASARISGAPSSKPAAGNPEASQTATAPTTRANPPKGKPVARSARQKEGRQANPTVANASQSPSKATGADQQSIECLASAIHHESRGEPIEGQIAVAEVIINRSRSKTYRNSICGVIRQRSQFSFVRGGVIPPIRSAAARTHARQIASGALAGALSSRARHALHFHSVAVRPNWARSQPIRIGRHLFYAG